MGKGLGVRSAGAKESSGVRVGASYVATQCAKGLCEACIGGYCLGRVENECVVGGLESWRCDLCIWQMCYEHAKWMVLNQLSENGLVCFGKLRLPTNADCKGHRDYLVIDDSRKQFVKLT